MLLHRPQDIPKRYIIKERLRTGKSVNYNLIERSVFQWYPAGWRINRKTIGRQHSRLHYLACHAPEPVKKKWAKVYNKFQAKYFGQIGKASVRYLNTYSAHSWM